MTDVQETEQIEAEVEFLEFLGFAPYGTEFLTSHTITPKQAEEAGWVTKLPADLVWSKRASGRYAGRMLLAVSEVPEGTAEELANDPLFSLVTLKA